MGSIHPSSRDEFWYGDRTMSDLGSIKVTLEQDAFEIFMATRLRGCMASKCKNHDFDTVQCSLRHVNIDETGKCEQFEVREK